MTPEESRQQTDRPYWTLESGDGVRPYESKYFAVRWRSTRHKRLLVGDSREEGQWVVDELEELEHKLWLIGQKALKYREGLQALERTSDWHDDTLATVAMTAQGYREQGDRQ